jgi:epoxyqueuosine reductase
MPDSGLHFILTGRLKGRQIFDCAGFMNNSNMASFPLIASIDKLAADHGLLFVGISALEMASEAVRYDAWIAEGRHGSMEWMENHRDIRANPERLLEGAKSAFVFGFPYFLGDQWTRGKRDQTPRVAQYARLRDYHKFMRSKLSRVQKDLEALLGSGHSFRITVDSAPVLERSLATKTGSMFIGKNTCAISPEKGSFFLLGEIITSWFHLELAKNTPSNHRDRSVSGGCGTCRRCQVHCPTGALDKDYQIDARKCLSYWTIEHRGEIPIEYWPWIAKYVFGCDICQLVCPYNRGLSPSAEAKSMLKIGDLNLAEIVFMDQAKYESIFAGTPMTRAKRSGLRRNALIASVVRKDPLILKHLESLTNDTDEVVRLTAQTAIDFCNSTKNSK